MRGQRGVGGADGESRDKTRCHHGGLLYFELRTT
jgi:hypothetical protein